MFHVEMRTGMHVVREFNLNDERLWLEFLAPLMAGREFSVEGHEFIPRETRIKIFEGPELRPDQLAMGRGWQSVERTAQDATERVLQRAREHAAQAQPTKTQASAPLSADLLRERLIGRITAGPIAGQEILAAAAELMPDASGTERQEAARHAAWALLERGSAQLAPPSSAR
jgi:hypothetical protein